MADELVLRVVVAEVDGVVAGHATARWLSFDAELARNIEDGWYLAGRNIWQGSSILMYCARSTNGTAWTTDNLGGNRAWSEPDLSLTTNTVCIAADPYYDSYIRVWRHQGSGWSTQTVSRVLGVPVYLGDVVQSTLLLVTLGMLLLQNYRIKRI